ncbi:MAG: hypothetical protein K2X87_34630 [Gemmataceae bacterium]|nr:hypothetical protein [Gemmataceae bacterium]
MRWLLAGLFLAPVAPAHGADPGPVVFTGVTVVDVEAGKLVPGRAVVVAGPKIVAVGAADGFAPPPGATVVPAAGKYLIPGLWDMHVHHEFPWPGPLDLALANGVTGVRDLNGEPFVLAWRDEIAAGKRRGPRIVASGKYLDARRNGEPPGRTNADTPERGREIVRARKTAGADLIKVYSGLRPDVYRAVVEEAKAQGLPVAGHCPERVSAFDAARLGQRSIEHLSGVALSTARDEAALRKEVAAAFDGPHGYDIDEAAPALTRAMEAPDADKQAALFAAFKEHATWQVPTLAVQRPLRPPTRTRGRSTCTPGSPSSGTASGRRTRTPTTERPGRPTPGPPSGPCTPPGCRSWPGRTPAGRSASTSSRGSPWPTSWSCWPGAG